MSPGENITYNLNLEQERICRRGMQQGEPLVKMGSMILLSPDDESTLSLYKVIHFDDIKKFDASTGRIYGYQHAI
jgi:hypothetical protein